MSIDPPIGYVRVPTLIRFDIQQVANLEGVMVARRRPSREKKFVGNSAGLNYAPPPSQIVTGEPEAAPMGAA